MADQDPNLREYGRYLALSQVAFEMVVPLGLGALIDWWMGWGYYWATVAGAIIGFVGGMVHLIVMAQAIEREETKKKKNGS